jgi:hypothetical protein
MHAENDNPAISRQVIEMITVAHEFCLYIEDIEKYDNDHILSFMQKIGPLLYLKGAMLPQDIEADPEFAERFVTEEQWEAIFKVLRVKLGPKDLYYILDENNDSKQQSLADNLADIYQDLKDFVMLYQKPPLHSKSWAVAELAGLFRTHWGKIILAALNQIHSLMFSDELPAGLENDWDY